MKYSLLILCTSVFSFFLFTDKVNDSIARKQTEEQIYLQTDRTFYKPAEDIWFTTWTVDRDDHTPSEISDIIYVDLINPKGKVEKSLRLLSRQGRSSGDFHLSDESPGGIYKLRAYSLWMKNIAEDNYFEKEITVQKVMLPNLLMKLKFLDKGYGAGQEAIAELDIKTLENEPLSDQKLKFEVLLDGKSYKKNSIITDKEGKALISFTLPGKLDSPDGTLNVTIDYQERMESISRTIPITLKNISLSFFPEGGNLVVGVNSRIAFKALDSYGKPSDIEGRILDDKNQFITSFKSFHDGMGIFSLKPLKGRKYHAIIDLPNSLKSRFKLPEIEGLTYALSVSATGKREFNVSFFSPEKSKVYLKAQIEGRIYFSKMVKAQEGINNLKISTEDMPAGILQITLYDKSNTEQCERLVFVNKDRTMNVSITTNKEKYLPREQVIMDIKTTDYQGNPVSADLALSVVNNNLLTFADDKQNHILSYLLLSSQLKGKIEEPLFYFKKDEPKADLALDYLLMTHCWRKFVWNDSTEVKYPAEKAQVKGRLIDHDGRPFRNHKVLVVETNDSVFTYNDGYFVFDNLILTNGLTFRALDVKGYKTDVKVNDYCNYFVLPEYISGTILDNNGLPVNNARISYLGVPVKTSTNNHGTFTIPKLKDHDLINIEHDLYLKKQIRIVGASVVKIVLEPLVASENQTIADEVIDDKQIGELAKQPANQKTEVLVDKSINNRELPPIPKNIEELIIVDDVKEIVNEFIVEDSEVDESGTIICTSVAKEEVEEEQIFMFVEKMPEFPGGEPNLRRFIAEHVEYPAVARECCIEGKVYVRFAVNKNGTVERVSIARGVDPILDNEALRVVKNLPKWQPGEQSGRKVTTWYTVPIVFNLIGGSGCGVCPEGYYCNFQIGELKQWQHTIQQTGIYRARQFYSPDYEKEQTIEERTDFRPTVYWNPGIKTDNNGKAQISFYNSDEISSFKAIAEGISSEGVVGRGEYTFYTQLPFAINAKIPEYLTFADELQVPVTLSNNTNKDITGTLNIQQMDALAFNGQSTSIQQIKASETKTIWLDYKVQNIAGKGEIQISFESEGLSDAIRKNIEVLPKGFPVQLAFSSNELNNKFTFDLEDIISGSLTADFKAYPNILSNLMQGIESILREPYGCFEQTSSSTYPNLLVLDYMKSTGNITASIKERALSLTDRGYKRLIGFETSEKGYEWFGNTPAHEGLTAYGLMEFTDMAEVYPNVDKEMVKRTQDKLLKSRDGKGGFSKREGLHNFNNVTFELQNAYIVYALSESGYFDIGPEFLKAYEDAITSNDAYKIALLANTAFNLKKISEGHKMLKMLDNQIDKHGFGKLVAKESIVRSQGKSLQIETASLYLMALLKLPNYDLRRIDEVVNYIATSRDAYGGFSSTQATVLALKSLTNYAKKMSNSKAAGDIELKINQKNFNAINYGAENSEPVNVSSLQEYFKTGKNSFSLQFKGTDKKVSYSLSIQYNKATPESSDECILEMSTELMQKKVQMGDVVRMNVSLKNKTNEYTPMAIVKIGIPSGLSLQPYQLKELLDKKMVDYYEIFNNYLVFYFTSLQPGQEISLPLDLKTELPGNFEAPASSAYLYYTNEFKHWVAGEKVEIRN